MRDKLYRVDKFGRPLFKVIMSDDTHYFISPNFKLSEMTNKKVVDFKKEVRLRYDDNFESDEYDTPILIKSIRFASTKKVKV